MSRSLLFSHLILASDSPTYLLRTSETRSQVKSELVGRPHFDLNNEEGQSDENEKMGKWKNGKMEKWKNGKKEKMENGTRCLMSEGKRNLVTESILLIVVTQVGREYQLATI